MLHIPEIGDSLVTVMGIDPGTTTMGIAGITFDCNTFEIYSCFANTYNSEKLPGFSYLSDFHSDRLLKLYRHKQNVFEALCRVKPVSLVIESPFINIRMPAAFGALTEVVLCIRQAAIEYDYWLPIYTVEPSNVKKAIGVSGGADKNNVRLGLQKNVELLNAFGGSIDHLDEHSVDAVCVAYSQFLKYQGKF
jgi:Holliday junction resolvasome RuvABC endonuclease subunit